MGEPRRADAAGPRLGPMVIVGAAMPRAPRSRCAGSCSRLRRDRARTSGRRFPRPYLKGERPVEDFTFAKAAALAAAGVDFRPRTGVEAIDRTARRVRLAGGRRGRLCEAAARHRPRAAPAAAAAGRSALRPCAARPGRRRPAARGDRATAHGSPLSAAASSASRSRRPHGRWVRRSPWSRWRPAC